MRRIIILMLAVLIILIVVYETDQTTRKITGSAADDAQISFRILSYCNIMLREGWNLISVCSNMTNKTVPNALKDIEGDYRYVLEWNESREGFEIFSPLAADNPFNELSENKSYFIYLLSQNDSINAGGKPFQDMEIPLFFGWNTPIYPYEFETEISGYLESINSSYRYVMVWNASGQKFLIFSPLAVENDFTNITGGEGQFIYVSNTSGAMLKYNRSALE